jgi:lipopolysaccharide assembly outer membrane protein LptD (OstA)
MEWEIEALNDDGWVEFDQTTQTATATNGVLVKYGGAVLTAREASLNHTTGDVQADGAVRIQQGEQIWASEHISFNFFSRKIQAEQFRTGRPPVFAGGFGLSADTTNNVYISTNAFITTEDISDPTVRIRARHIKIIPGERIVARDAVLYAGKVPIFWFPYFSKRLTGQPNHFSVTPGYRSAFGAFALGSYRWFGNEQIDGQLNLDYRVKRGVGLGPDVNYDFGRWGRGDFTYYYLHDEDPNESLDDPVIPADRQRVRLSYDAHPATNWNVKSMVRYESDISVERDFFEGDYRRNPQPNTYLEVNKFWDNWSLDLYAQPRLNEFLETVERLPEVRLTGFRQQIGNTPIYYDSQSSAGWYRRLFADNDGTNAYPSGLDYSAARADSYHQLTLPHTFFGWLTLAPRAGGRFTYYSEAHEPGGNTSEEYRGVFNTGVEATMKASRLWPEVESSFFDLDGLRHIVEPSANYVYVPDPNVGPDALPQFDYEFASLRLLPIDFTDYNAIDSIDSQHAVRLGLRNRLQTKRDGQVVTVVDWDLYSDVRIHPDDGLGQFSDVFSDLGLRPAKWLALESLLRYDTDEGRFRLALHTMTLQPTETVSFGLGHWYVRDDPRPSPEGLGEGNNVLTTTFFYKLNENWAVRAAQHWDLEEGRMREQNYTLYRDLRSWTAGLVFRIRDNEDSDDDFTVAFTFSLKAAPKDGIGQDTLRSYSLLGGG